MAETPDSDVAVLMQVRRALRGLLLIAGIGAMYFARDFLMPVVMALFIAITFRPPVRYLARHHVPPWLSALLLAVLLVIGGLWGGYVLTIQVSDWIDQAPQISAAVTTKLSVLRSSLDAVANLTNQIQDASAAVRTSAVQEVFVRESALPTLLGLVTGYPVQFIITLLATLVFTVFLMASGDMFYEKLIRVLPTLTDRKNALRIVYNIEAEVSNYILTLSVINAVLGLVVAFSFHALGMPQPYLWGLLIFFLNFIPYVGTVIGVVASTLIAIATFDSIGYALVVPLVFLVWSLIESEIANPLILSRRMQMNSVAILLSLAFWAWLWGIAGAALAMPVLVTLKVLCDQISGLQGFSEFLSGNHSAELTTTET